MSTLVRHCAQLEFAKLREAWYRKWLKGSEKWWILKQNLRTLIFPDSLEDENFDSKATKIQKSNILINLRRPLVRICVIIDKMSKFTYFWRFEAYLIKLLHLVDFSCWGPKVRFLGYLGAILGQTLEVEIRLYTSN